MLFTLPRSDTKRHSSLMPTIVQIKSWTCFQCCTWRSDSAVVGNDARRENGPQAPREDWPQESPQASQSSPGWLLLGVLVRSLSSTSTQVFSTPFIPCSGLRQPVRQTSIFVRFTALHNYSWLAFFPSGYHFPRLMLLHVTCKGQFVCVCYCFYTLRRQQNYLPWQWCSSSSH